MKKVVPRLAAKRRQNEARGREPRVEGKSAASREAAKERQALVHIPHRASARPAWISAGPASPHASRCTRATLRGYREGRNLRRELLAMTLRAVGLLTAIYQRLKLMIAFLADVLKDGHESTPALTKQEAQKHHLYLKSERGQHAIRLPANTL